jgi:hypothetical protein
VQVTQNQPLLLILDKNIKTLFHSLVCLYITRIHFSDRRHYLIANKVLSRINQAILSMACTKTGSAGF